MTIFYISCLILPVLLLPTLIHSLLNAKRLFQLTDSKNTGNVYLTVCYYYPLHQCFELNLPLHRTAQSKCLNDSSDHKVSIPQGLPGKLYNGDDQCVRMFGAGSSVCQMPEYKKVR